MVSGSFYFQQVGLSGASVSTAPNKYTYIKAPFTLLRFCTKTERKTSVFVKVFTLIRTKTPQKRRFSKTKSKVDIQKTEVFENAFDQCERTKTEVFENAAVSNNELHKNGVM